MSQFEILNILVERVKRYGTENQSNIYNINTATQRGYYFFFTPDHGGKPPLSFEVEALT